MRLKSTGLGSTELFGNLTEMEKSMSGVLMMVKIEKPVVWRVRVFLSPQDLRAIVWRALMPWNVQFVITTLLRQCLKHFVDNKLSLRKRPLKNQV
ncbi:hypothetical protein PITCH_A1330013 [uncultured Desulfobacterium sp.]|jgi:hypothetical protein|uniref:Uncharacterized protein n=1 Tax=uncultured Desulfobacterium sp. TaxID=201089 RepID=A0A445MSE9_9BACT|nr:hypothetical protein PITCH_A1330013 [uncultured Desulfobacterium sp.]